MTVDNAARVFDLQRASFQDLPVNPGFGALASGDGDPQWGRFTRDNGPRMPDKFR
jgi:hypothetical protein